MIETNENIRGIKMDNYEIKMTQFADDTTLILDGSCSSLQAALNTLEIFGNYSGLKINTEKTQIVWIGKKRCSSDKLNVKESLLWGSINFRLLGIEMSVKLKDIVDLNYRPLIENLHNQLNSWKKRYLTPFGKIIVIKTFIISKFVHLFTSIPSPSSSMLNKINTMLFQFVWNNNPTKLKEMSLFLTLIKGV